MVAEIMVKGYGVMKIKGIYPEGMTQETGEESYLVFDNKNKGGLLELLLKLGELYNQDSIYFKPKDSLTGYLLGTNDADFPGYHQKGTESKFMVSTASNYMSRIGNNAFAFVSDDAIKNDNKEQAMAEIEKEITDQGYANQHFWQDNDKTSFKNRKQQRINNESIIYNLFKICENTKGGSHIDNLFSLHPLTRKSLSEHYKKIQYKLNNTKCINLTESQLRYIVENVVKNVLLNKQN